VPPEDEHSRDRPHVPAGETGMEAADSVSLVVFRLGTQWLALSTQVVKEVTEMLTIRSIPQRTTEVLLGLVNLRGELQLCISLKGILGLDNAYVRGRDDGQPRTARLMVIEKEGDGWIFPADEVLGVFPFAPGEVHELPSTPTEGGVPARKGMVYWQERAVSYLDETVLFDTLKRRIS
jgi:chemotaxis-related protein WspD